MNWYENYIEYVVFVVVCFFGIYTIFGCVQTILIVFDKIYHRHIVIPFTPNIDIYKKNLVFKKSTRERVFKQIHVVINRFSINVVIVDVSSDYVTNSSETDLVHLR